LRLEDLQTDATVRGILPDALVTVVSVAWHGSGALTLVYRAPNGRVADGILYRHDQPRLEVVESGRPWSFDGDGALFRLVAEAHRIRLAHLFDPALAVHTSLDEDVQQNLSAPDCRYDLVVCDEAHKFSAIFFGGEVKYCLPEARGKVVLA
jgi:hypothetical protein